MQILMIGDIIGRPGRQAVQRFLPALRQQYGLDMVIANAENSAGGFGLTPETAEELLGAGIDVLPQEPPVDSDPLLDPSIPNLIVTPHVAWAARESRQRAVDEIAANIRSFLEGGRRGRVI